MTERRRNDGATISNRANIAYFNCGCGVVVCAKIPC
jgi:hypothetical protein